MHSYRVVSILGLFLLLAGTPHHAMAQATPDVGAEITITDIEGNELGIITVEEVEDPFEGYAEGSEPGEDGRYVLFTVAFEATGDDPFDTNPGSLVLRDVDGFHWSTFFFAREEDDTRPDLQAQTLSPGNRISGVVGFQLPEDAELEKLFYQPESSRLIEVANLQEDPEPGPVLGDEVTYESVEVPGAEGIVLVDDLEDPFEDLTEGVEPAEEARYLILTISFEATGDEPLNADPFDLVLRDSDGFLWGWASVPRADPTPPEFQSQTLAPGNRISGVVGFQVPENAELADLFWQPETGRLIRLVDFAAETNGADEDLAEPEGTPAD